VQGGKVNALRQKVSFNKLILLAILLCIVFSLFLGGCAPSAKKEQKKYSGQGVLVTSVEGRLGVFVIENTNAFPVKIRYANIRGHYGEVTQWMKSLESEQKLEVSVSTYWILYIYNNDGGLIGVIKYD
jgi:hypothetical protein